MTHIVPDPADIIRQIQGERITYLHNKPCEQAMH